MAKTCAKCGQSADDHEQFCTGCNSTEFIGAAADVHTQVYTQPTPAYTLNGQQGGLPEIPEKEKVLAGILGAILFSLAGGVLYVILYQFGILAAICGWLTFFLAGVGYKKFSKTKENFSVKSLIISIVMLFAVILVAEYVCLAIDIYKVYIEYYDITLLDAFFAAPEFLAEKDVLMAVLGDLGFSYLFGVIAVIGDIMKFVKGRKAEKEALNAPQQVPVCRSDSYPAEQPAADQAEQSAE